MLHHKGSGSARHARISLVALGVAATAAAAFVAATAIPAYANGSHGNSGSKGNSASHSQSASHRQDTGHSQKGLHGNNGSQGSTGARGNSANAHEHVTICHATPPDTAANGYVEISPSAAGVYNGHLKEHAADIIPPFTYSGQTYSLNWDAAGQAIFANGCVVPAATTSGAVQGAEHSKSNGNGASGSQGNSANAHEHVTICHATPPDTAANGYVEISPSAAGVYNGHLKEHAADIIPPFTYSGQTYSLNWDANGQAIFANGCVVPSLQSLTLPNVTLPNLTLPVSTGFVAAAKATVKAMLAALKPQTAAAARQSGVLGAHKTLKGVAGRAHAVRAVTRSATFTG
jgi:hypothetical protein